MWNRATMVEQFLCTILLACLLMTEPAETILPTDCKLSTSHRYKDTGTPLAVENEVESANACAELCLRSKCRDTRPYCILINYFPSTKKCELIRNDIRSTFVRDPNSIAVLPYFSSCCQKKPFSITFPPSIEAPMLRPTPIPDSVRPISENSFVGTCGKTSVPQKVSRAQLNRRTTFQRIVGGTEANAHSVPFIVSLRIGGRHYCGGSLIRVNAKDESDVVLTAAHCVSDEVDSPSSTVVAGAHRLSQTENGEESARIVKVLLHENYEKPITSTNDIALVKLSRPIKFSNTIQAVCLLAQGERLKDGTNGIIAGWGRLKQGGGRAEALMQVVLPTVGHSKCKITYGSKLVEETMLCAGLERGQKDSCQGDSGGPYFFEGADGYTLQGVVSWGYGCARPKVPGVYTRVSTYADWIQQKIRVLSG